jgi:stress response protein YsnF
MRPDPNIPDQAPHAETEPPAPEGVREIRIPIVEEEVTVRKVPRVKEEIIIRIERETVIEEREVEVRRERVEVIPEGSVDVEGPDDLIRRSR